MNLIILFSGQGLQSQKHVNEILTYISEHERSILSAMAPELFNENSDSDKLFDNKVAQPFIYTLQYYRWHQLRQLIAAPTAFAGYSLGEANAFCCSSQITFEGGLDLVSKRANLMQQEVTESSGLLAIKGVSDRNLEQLLEESNTYLSIKINRDQFIIGGNKNDLEQAAQVAQTLGAQSVQLLNVSVPSHTAMMQGAAEGFRKYTKTLALPSMTTPIISATEGIRYSDTHQGLEILSRQIDHALDWYFCMENIEEYQPSMVIEIGPGNALSRMVNNLLPHVPCRSWDDFRNVDGLKEWIDRNS
ncbi:malonate decarboxylase subunit epsilon [Psychrobacter sp. ANT_H59]|uniref:malonate decarboxylase subunit epsilon n=1 Tax=Psychrobacter sp. ANT_H59 TaxID=2597354 RepID=UPI0011EF1A1C|nr:malonate decarboxylase subunit epsilon [Psychrobacter sp. ANT_H59]KAA0934562.1 malonate decarboxylase subunit epsilon [Psychrobacter sp. ANT_H59]